jgi:branched-chain amino acid transport system permease protein
MAVNILVLASVYILLASGYVIVYRTSRVLNFAHGDIFMVGGYLAFTTIAVFAVHPLLAFPIAAGGGVVAGALVYVVLMAPMAGHSLFAAVLATIGLGIMIRGAALIAYGGQILYPGRILGVENKVVPLLPGYALTTMEIYIVLSMVAVVAALLLFFRYSTVGIQMRAASHDPRLAAYRGVNIHLLFAGAWAMATAIGMFTSALYSFNQQVSPSLSDLALKALAVALVGGMDSLKGAVPAAFLVAALEIMTQHYVSVQASEAVPFLMLVLALLIRPWGLMGTKEAIDRI